MNPDVRDITIEYLQNTKIGENLKKAMCALQNVQETAYAYVNDNSPEQLKQIRIGTVLAFSIMNKLFSGKSIKEFDEADWKEIAANVSEKAICIDPRQYSINVFSAYANYVDISVKVLKAKGISDDKCDAISALAETVRDLSDKLVKEEIPEVDYTEQCLWLMLEAMIKLIATNSSIVIGDDASEFVQSMALYAFEYGRYALYQKEQELLTLYIEHQNKFDDELRIKLEAYQNELQQRQEDFDHLISDAFDPDMASRLKSTVMIARTVGVNDSEILDSIQKVDDFFM